MKVIKIKSNHLEIAGWVDTKQIRLFVLFAGFCWQYKSGYFALEFHLPFVGGVVVYFNDYKEY